jgi:hypothetical protein
VRHSFIPKLVGIAKGNLAFAVGLMAAGGDMTALQAVAVAVSLSSLVPLPDFSRT